MYICVAGDIFLLLPLSAVLSFSVQGIEENESPVYFFFREYFVKYALNSTTEKKRQSQKYFSCGDYLIKKNNALSLI